MVAMAIFCLVCGCVGLYATIREWDEFDGIFEDWK